MTTTEPGFFEAYEAVVGPLTAARNLAALIEGAASSGLLPALREPVTIENLLTVTGLSRETIASVVRALVACQVITHDGACYRLTPEWRAVTDPAAYVPLDRALRGSSVEAGLLQGIASGRTYWTMPSEDRLDYARSISPNPFSPELVAAVQQNAEMSPVRSRMQQGAHMLELGCGVAGQLLTYLQAFPGLTAVGIELADDLADEAERRAEALGVADRFTVLRTDAAAFDGEGQFDLAHWSQFFFPAPSRAGATQALFRSLKPGGLAYAPMPFDFEGIAGDPTGPAARDHALMWLVLGSWGVPEHNLEQLSAEFVDAGFTDVRLVRVPGDVPRVVATRP